MQKVTIEGEYITLAQFLKKINIAMSGGHAKQLIQSGMVQVNQEVSFQRGKKLKKGDQILVDGSMYGIE